MFIWMTEKHNALFSYVSLQQIKSGASHLISAYGVSVNGELFP